MNLPAVYGMIFFAIVCVSTVSIMIRYCTAPSSVIAFYRVMFTSVLGGAVGCRDVRSAVVSISRSDPLYCLVAGFFLALHFGFWITSLSYTTVSSSVLFTNLQVIFVLLFSLVFLKEKLNYRVVGGIFLALAGSILIGGGDNLGREVPGRHACPYQRCICGWLLYYRPPSTVAGGYLDLYSGGKQYGYSGIIPGSGGGRPEFISLPQIRLCFVLLAGSGPWHWRPYHIQLGLEICKSPVGGRLHPGRERYGEHSCLLLLRGDTSMVSDAGGSIHSFGHLYRRP